MSTPLPAFLPKETHTIDVPGWRELVSTLSLELTHPLSQALERVQHMAQSGRIDRTSLQALHEEIKQARRISIAGQQLSRLASGKVNQTPERLQVAKVLRQILTLHAGAIEYHGATIQPAFCSVEVVTDPSLLFNLLESLITWCLSLAISPIALYIEVKTWPHNARLCGHFSYGTPHESEVVLNTLAWKVVEQTAHVMGLTLQRQTQLGRTEFAIEFVRTVHEPISGVSTIELHQGMPHLLGSQPWADTQALIIVSDPELRNQINDAIKDLGLVIDFVNSIEEARQFCLDNIPQVLIVQADLSTPALEQLRHDLDASGEQVAFVDILAQGHSFEISDITHSGIARVGRDALSSSLSPALVFELSKFG